MTMSGARRFKSEWEERKWSHRVAFSRSRVEERRLEIRLGMVRSSELFLFLKMGDRHI